MIPQFPRSMVGFTDALTKGKSLKIGPGFAFFDSASRWVMCKFYQVCESLYYDKHKKRNMDYEKCNSAVWSKFLLAAFPVATRNLNLVVHSCCYRVNPLSCDLHQ